MVQFEFFGDVTLTAYSAAMPFGSRIGPSFGGKIEDQFTFAQALTEAVKGTPGVLLAPERPGLFAGSERKPCQAGESGRI